MIRFGGSFVKALGHAWQFADEVNFQRLKKTFPEYWQKYGQMAASVLRQNQ